MTTSPAQPADGAAKPAVEKPGEAFADKAMAFMKEHAVAIAAVAAIAAAAYFIGPKAALAVGVLAGGTAISSTLAKGGFNMVKEKLGFGGESSGPIDFVKNKFNDLKEKLGFGKSAATPGAK